MIVESSVTAITWIPSEAVRGATKLPFEVGVSHYDDPPPETLDGPEAVATLCDADRFRFANVLRAWIEVEAGAIVAHGQSSASAMGSTTLRLGRSVTFAGVTLPEIHGEPEVGDGWVRFTQTAGGRAGILAPRAVKHPPYVQIVPPLAWTTLSLTLHADGRVEQELTGASPFPRHWVYDGDGKLALKSGLIDFRGWYRKAFGKHSPWGDEDSPALAAEVETALERQLSSLIMRRGAKPKMKKVRPGRALVEQGQAGHEMYVLLDGILSVEVDGEPVAELGPGAVMGERALLEGGLRTSTLRAVTTCRVAQAREADVDPALLERLREGHRREEEPEGVPAS